MKAKYRKIIVMFLACASVVTIAVHDAVAHHSDSLYFIDDRAADGGAIKIEGTVSRVRWINPHTEFFVDVPNASGAPAVWAIETDSVNQLRALGWSEATLQVGDQVIVVVSKSKFDDTAGRLRDILVYGSTPEEKTAIYLEYKVDGSPEWQAPLEVYRKYTSCPGTAPYDPERQPGKETLLCATLDANELAAAREEFGERVLLLRGK
ncbi:MAG TPA: DUF6152 family protein [Gammaproteobacteria bacterium]|nr:DUF6152 family protein [Gammaproteobacteria bacterium]